jgi:hypothetical protein
VSGFQRKNNYEVSEEGSRPELRYGDMRYATAKVSRL